MGSGRINSSIRLENLGSGQAGDLNISAQNILLERGGQINNQTFGLGTSGNIKVEASNIFSAIGAPEIAPAAYVSGSTTSSFNRGNAGNVSVTAREINILGGASIGSVTFGEGNGGNLIVNASELLRLNGVESRTIVSSTISISAFGTLGNGSGGQLNINSLTQ